LTEKETFQAAKALKLRKRAKRKKPEFARPESWRYTRLKENWRRPRGLDNKVRKNVKGWPPLVRAGYRGPKVARGLHPSGYREVLVHNAEELKEIDPKTQAIRIAHTVGKRKRAKIITEARKRKLTILNVREVKEKVEEKKAEEKEKEEETEKEEREPEKEEKAEEETEVEKPKKEKKPRKRKRSKEEQ
jgi:large subunit ribosomal protein L32e